MVSTITRIGANERFVPFGKDIKLMTFCKIESIHEEFQTYDALGVLNFQRRVYATVLSLRRVTARLTLVELLDASHQNFLTNPTLSSSSSSTSSSSSSSSWPSSSSSSSTSSESSSHNTASASTSRKRTDQIRLILKVRDGFLSESDIRILCEIVEQRKQDVALDVLAFVERDATVPNDEDFDDDNNNNNNYNNDKLLSVLHAMTVKVYDQQKQQLLLEIRKDPLPVSACFAWHFDSDARSSFRRFALKNRTITLLMSRNNIRKRVTAVI
jgi:hypothetical protein